MKNRFSQASVFFALIAAMLFIPFHVPEASAIPFEDPAWSSAQSGEKDCDLWSCWFGCCDANGNCHTEGSSDYCGYYGEDCNACAYPTPYCFNEGVYAQCTACNFLTCPVGCCDEEGRCHHDGSSEYCGYYGEDCNACEVPTPYCFNEGVYAQCTGCNVLTCPLGCCGDDGYCHEEDDAEYCGYAGLSCDTCTGDTPNCWAGLCVGCDAITCATGCCDSGNVCHTENNNEFCGIAGASCFSCSGDTPNCYNGWCVGCSNDFPCPDGCCDFRTSLCHPGDSNEMCGGVGSSCDNCEIDALFCRSGQCISCDAGTCPDGCCDSNGACRTGTENNFCGTGATGCVNCVSSGMICVEFTCVFPADDDVDDDIDDDGDDTGYPACGPDNCLAGCCMNGQCWPGDRDDKCGDYANPCEDCQASGEICKDYQCLVADDDILPDDDAADDDTTDDDYLSDDDSADDDATPSGDSNDKGDIRGGCAC